MTTRKNAFIKTIELLCSMLPALFWGLMIFGFEEVSTAIATLLSALIHECGHIAYILFIDKSGFGFKGVLSGFRIKAHAPISYDEEIGRYLAGPMANIITFVIAVLLGKIAGNFFVTLAAISLATAISNLLPIRGYDGYGIIRAIIEKREICSLAIKALGWVSSSLIFTLCILSLYLIDRHGGGYWIFAVFFISMIKEFAEGLGE